jgi:hypothetical protein
MPALLDRGSLALRLMLKGLPPIKLNRDRIVRWKRAAMSEQTMLAVQVHQYGGPYNVVRGKNCVFDINQ